MTRGQMAAFSGASPRLVRPARRSLRRRRGVGVRSRHRAAGRIGGHQRLQPPVNDNFCPDDPVTRGQMAAFLVRAFGYSVGGGETCSAMTTSRCSKATSTGWRRPVSRQGAIRPSTISSVRTIRSPWPDGGLPPPSTRVITESPLAACGSLSPPFWGTQPQDTPLRSPMELPIRFPLVVSPWDGFARDTRFAVGEAGD